MPHLQGVILHIITAKFTANHRPSDIDESRVQSNIGIPGQPSIRLLFPTGSRKQTVFISNKKATKLYALRREEPHLLINSRILWGKMGEKSDYTQSSIPPVHKQAQAKSIAAYVRNQKKKVGTERQITSR
ncbi:hypothetical protein J6590_025390 [Homalodisca vitripennis]|nr:hypothetical protein J6590_025390 [Homalodisca vitripennis]